MRVTVSIAQRPSQAASHQGRGEGRTFYHGDVHFWTPACQVGKLARKQTHYDQEAQTAKSSKAGTPRGRGCSGAVMRGVAGCSGGPQGARRMAALDLRSPCPGVCR